jgi:hypothetical protein
MSVATAQTDSGCIVLLEPDDPRAIQATPIDEPAGDVAGYGTLVEQRATNQLKSVN